MSENDFIESLEKSVNYMNLGTSDINEFNQIYIKNSKENKFKDSVNIIDVKQDVLEEPFLKELRSKVKEAQQINIKGNNSLWQ